MSNKSKSLSWCDRFALIDHYQPSDDDIISIMGVTKDQLDTARELRATGTIVATPNLDVDSYGKMFGATVPAVSKPATTKSSATSVTKPVPATTGGAPQTASPAPRVPKKRGRKGTNISNAFSNIPTTAVSAEQFASDNNVSLAVLRQSRRFDTCPQNGTVHVKKDKQTKTLMIWRDAPSS